MSSQRAGLFLAYASTPFSIPRTCYPLNMCDGPEEYVGSFNWIMLWKGAGFILTITVGSIALQTRGSWLIAKHLGWIWGIDLTLTLVEARMPNGIHAS